MDKIFLNDDNEAKNRHERREVLHDVAVVFVSCQKKTDSRRRRIRANGFRRACVADTVDGDDEATDDYRTDKDKESLHEIINQKKNCYTIIVIIIIVTRLLFNRGARPCNNN